MPDSETPSEFLQQLSALNYRTRRPGQKTVAGYELYLVDLSDWKLNLSDRTLLIWVKAETAGHLPARELVASLQDVAREQGSHHRECLVVLDGDGQELKAQTVNQYFPRFVVIDVLDQRNIFAAHSFTNALLDLICEQIPIANLAPYQVSAPVEGSGFFGRKREIDKILRQTETNFAVLGLRRIGKTSLLKEIRRRLLDQGEKPERIVWLDGSTLSSPQQFTEEVVRHLNVRELPRLQKARNSLFYFPDFLKRMSKMHGGRITIFLDEADRFLMWARDVGDLLSVLRGSVNAGNCRYVVSGFQTLMEESQSENSPFYKAFEPLHLQPFDRQETAEVVLRPMTSLRVRFTDEKAVLAQIHHDTGGHPFLVQYYCLQLVSQLERQGDRVLSPESLNSIYISDSFKNLIINVFRDNISVQDKVLVYALLSAFPEDKETFTQEEMYGALRKAGCSPSSDEIDRTCDRLVLAGVFYRKGPKYQFANPILPRTMRANQNIDYLLSVARKEIGL